MKVLITGGAGYIGSHCNKYFYKMGIETVVLDNMLFGHKEAVCGGRFVLGDFGDRALLESLFAAEKFDGIIHFAALADVADSVAEPEKYYNVNVCKMKTLLDIMVQFHVKHIVFSSSAATFGEPKYIPIDENHSQNPINPYGTTKLIGEKMLMDYEKAYGIKFCAMRYFNAAGADPETEIGESHNPEHHILPLIFKTALGQRAKFYVFGNDYDTKDGTCLRDYIHVSDLAEAHFLAFQYLRENNISQSFNLGNNAGFTVLDIIKAFEEIAGVRLDYEIAERRVGDPAKLVASNVKARKILRWTPTRSGIGNIIRDAWTWENNRRF